MVVNTTCMQAGLADPRADAYQLEIINMELQEGSHCQISATAGIS